MDDAMSAASATPVARIRRSDMPPSFCVLCLGGGLASANPSGLAIRRRRNEEGPARGGERAPRNERTLEDQWFQVVLTGRMTAPRPGSPVRPSTVQVPVGGTQKV